MARKDPNLEIALQEGWSSACQLYEHLLRGGDLTVLPPSAVRLQPDELPHSDAMLGYARFYGMNVSYDRSSMMLLGSATFVAAGLAANAMANSSAKRKAQAMAAAQWRDHAHVRTMLTNKRLLCDFSGQWLSFWHEGVVEFQCDLTQWLFVLRYEVGDPIMLHGPAAPWFAVSVARIVYGPRGLQLPAFAPLAQAVAQAAQERGQIAPGTPAPGGVISGEVVNGPAALPPA